MMVRFYRAGVLSSLPASTVGCFLVFPWILSPQSCLLRSQCHALKVILRTSLHLRKSFRKWKESSCDPHCSLRQSMSYHRMVWVGRDHSRSPSPATLQSPGTSATRAGYSWSSKEPDLQQFQGCCISHLSRQPGPGSHYLGCKMFLPYRNWLLDLCQKTQGSYLQNRIGIGLYWNAGNESDFLVPQTK